MSLALARADLEQSTVEVLNRGNPRNPDVLLVEVDGVRAVVKDFAPRSPWVRATLGRIVTRREVRAYRALDAHPSVPRFLGHIDALAFLIEYRPGHRMSRRLRGQIPPGFGGRLERAVAAMHRAGVVHLDLRHRSNVLVDPAGDPILIDFGSAVCMRPGSWWARQAVRWLGSADRSAVEKWRQKLDSPADSSPRRGASRPT